MAPCRCPCGGPKGGSRCPVPGAGNTAAGGGAPGPVPGGVPARGPALGHTHPNAPEFVYVVAGEPVLGDARGERKGRPGTVQFVPPGEIHWRWNTGDTTVEVVGGYLGASSFENPGYRPLGERPPDV
ncbi:MAG: cupin domain-containing protein [Actinomycetota bacterium]|nr:cupin domain-containing protein [Actinomycetota bacterium]